jgi:hypothetical protein
LAAVQSLPTFRCSVCGQTIVVPLGVAHPSRRTERRPAAAASRSAGRRPAPTPRSNTTLFAVVGAVSLGGIAALYASMSNHGAPTPAVAPPAAPAAPQADPDKDPAAWKALAPAERAARVRSRLAGFDHRDVAALRRNFDFFEARGEHDAAMQIAQDVVDVQPSCGWAHAARGDVEILPVIEACLDKCARADEMETPGVQRLAALRKDRQPATGAWWADKDLATQINGLLQQVRDEDKALDDPFQRAVAKWIVWQRKIDVMKDHPAITGTTGPYLLFVQIKAPAGTPMDRIDRAEIDRAKQVLKKNQELFASFYDGFQTCLGEAFALPQFDSSKVDEKSLLKANIFADESTWKLYHKRVYGTETPGVGIRAYYGILEPRFITTFDGGESETAIETDQVQCHEATHQLLHLFTWDVTRKATGRELGWVQCDTRPLWLDEGFAEFFSSHKREGGKRVWMQPLEGRMEESWVLSQVFAKKGWTDWTLDELLATTSVDEIERIAMRRAVAKSGGDDADLARLAMALDMFHSQLYGRSWGLVYFLWNDVDSAGKPRWREGFQRLMRQSLRVDLVPETITGPPRHVLTAADVKKALGLVGEEQYRAFEKSWLAWESGFLARSKRPEWEAARDRAFKRLGIR